MKTFLCIVLTLCCLSAKAVGDPNEHPFHATVCNIKINPADSTVQITLKLFADDIDLALRKLNRVEAHFGTAQEIPEAGNLFLNYLYSQFWLSADGKGLDIHFLGRETDEYDPTVLWCYLEVVNQPAISALTIHNSLLTDFFSDQSNVVHVKYRDREPSFILNWKTPEESIKLF